MVLYYLSIFCTLIQLAHFAVIWLLPWSSDNLINEQLDVEMLIDIKEHVSIPENQVLAIDKIKILLKPYTLTKSQVLPTFISTRKYALTLGISPENDVSSS